MLRAISRQEVIDTVENSFLGRENYAISFGQADTHVVFQITFLANTQFSFTARRTGGMSYKTFEAPSENYLTMEEYESRSLPVVLQRLSGWLQRVREEVISINPFAKEVAELRERLDERLASLGEDLSGFFTKEEAQDLRNSLDLLTSRMNDLASRNESLAATLETLLKTISDLQETINTLNRGTWFRMAGGRLLTALKAIALSKEARDFALEAAKKFLLPSPK